MNLHFASLIIEKIIRVVFVLFTDFYYRLTDNRKRLSIISRKAKVVISVWIYQRGLQILWFLDQNSSWYELRAVVNFISEQDFAQWAIADIEAI